MTLQKYKKKFEKRTFGDVYFGNEASILLCSTSREEKSLCHKKDTFILWATRKSYGRNVCFV